MPQPVPLDELKRRLEALSPAHRLIVASQLMTAGKHDLAIVIAECVVMEYRAAQALAK